MKNLLRVFSLILVWAFLAATPAEAAFGDFVQSNAVTGASGSITTPTISAATSGNLIVCALSRSDSSGTLPSVTGYTNIHSGQANALSGTWFYKVSTGGETTITLTGESGTGGNWRAVCAEFTGPFDTLDVKAENETNMSATGCTVASGTTSSTSSNSELAVTFFAGDAASNIDGSRAYSNSFTERAFESAGTSPARVSAQIASKVLTTTGTQTSTFTCSDTGDELYGSIATFKELVAGSSPTVALNTTDATTLNSTGPLEFTGTDADGDSIRYNVQVANNSNFDTAGTNTTDTITTASASIVHPNPHASETSPTTGNIQMDDRPCTTVLARGGILDTVKFTIARDEADTNGTSYIRFYAITGTPGSSAQPSGASLIDGGDNTPTAGWLAVSDGIAMDNTLSTSPTKYSYVFSGANRIVTTGGTYYMACLDWVPVNRTITNTIGVYMSTELADTDGNVWIDGTSVNYGLNLTFDGVFDLLEVQTLFDTVSNTDLGFLNTVSGGDTDPFNSGEKVRLTIPCGSALGISGPTYSWRARGFDPSGTASYGAFSSARTFTVTTSGCSTTGSSSTLIGVGR